MKLKTGAKIRFIKDFYGGIKQGDIRTVKWDNRPSYGSREGFYITEDDDDKNLDSGYWIGSAELGEVFHLVNKPKKNLPSWW